MPIYSMTGFARVQVRCRCAMKASLSYTLSVKSVNHRFLDVQLRLPSGLDALRWSCARRSKSSLVRGHVELTLSVDRSSQQKTGYNRELVAGYLAAFAAARDEYRLNGEPDLNAILRLPGALQTENRGDEDLAALTESVQQRDRAAARAIESQCARAKANRSRPFCTARSTGWQRPPMAWPRCAPRLSSAIRSG